MKFPAFNPKKTLSLFVPLLEAPAFLFLFLLLPLAAESSLPQRYPLSRYDELQKHLPFGKPTVIEVEAPKPPPFTEDLSLLGYSKINSGYFVTLVNKKTQQKIYLSEKEKPDGITIAEIINNNDISKVEIKLKKGDELASVKFDPNLLSGQPSNQPPFPGQFPQQLQQVNNGQPPFQNTPQNGVPIAQPFQQNNIQPPQPPQNVNVPPPQNINTNTPQQNFPQRFRKVLVPPKAP